MKSEQHEVKKAAIKLGAQVHDEKSKEYQTLAENIVQKGMVPKDIMGMSDAMVEGIYGQAYRLYNTGKYKDASQLFRLLIMLNSTESKYTMGLAACFHMLKEYKAAVETYAICGIIDPSNPIPHFHASDCYIQMKDLVSAMISLEMAIKRSSNKPEYKTLRDRAELTIKSLRKDIDEKSKKK